MYCVCFMPASIARKDSDRNAFTPSPSLARIFTTYPYFCSSVGIATDYGLDGPGSNPGGDEIFRPSRPAMGPTQPHVQRVPGLSRG